MFPNDGVLWFFHKTITFFPGQGGKAWALCSANLCEDGFGEFTLGCATRGLGSG